MMTGRAGVTLIEPADVEVSIGSGSTGSRLDKMIPVGLLAAVVFTALAHGSVEAWSVAIFQLIVSGLVLLWALHSVVAGRLAVNIPVTALPIAALVGMALVQSFTGLSVDAEATRGAATVIFFLLVCHIIAATFVSSRTRLQTLANFLIVYGLAMALFALIQHFTWEGRFFWARPNTQSVSPFGPFVNHNHFAGYMEMLLFVPASLAVTRAVRTEARVFYSFAAVMMGISIVASLSRGGLISVFAGMVFLVAANSRLRKHRHPEFRRGLSSLSQGLAIGVIAIGIVAGVVWIGAGPVIDRAAQTVQESGGDNSVLDLAGRGAIWRDTLSMIGANPVFGVGLGAYETAYSLYDHAGASLIVGAAHNDFLQVTADCGLIGAAIAGWFLTVLFRAMVRGARSRDPFRAALALGCGSGLFALSVHSLFDFNLQLPGNALLFLLLAAMTVQSAAPDARPEPVSWR